MARKSLIVGIILTLFFSGSLAHAQVRSSDLVLSVSPEYPSPNQNVTATISSYVTDLNKAHISWSLNNQEMSQGVGKKTFLFTTGNLGSSSNLSVLVNTVDGQSIQKMIMLTATNVDILWQAADAYVPPFYRGKTLVPSQGTFKVVAMPNLSNLSGKISMENLSYAWSKDGDVQPSSSGWGKNYFTFLNSYLDRGNTVDVKVSDITGASNASNTVALSTASPQIKFYKSDPVLGTHWQQAVSSGSMISSDGETLVAEPYFFSPEDLNSSDLDFDWYVNGQQVSTPSPKNILSVKPDEGETGSAEIKLMINNTATLFQSAEKKINVQF